MLRNVSEVGALEPSIIFCSHWMGASGVDNPNRLAALGDDEAIASPVGASANSIAVSKTSAFFFMA